MILLTATVTVSAACAAAYLLLLVGKAVLALRYAHRYPMPPAPLRESRQRGDLAAATIVQPILSGDPDLSATLEDMLTQLPEARFIWLVDADDDEAERVTTALQRRHAAHRIERCLCPEPPPGINPKLFKLEQARGLVTDGAFVVVDDDTRLTRDGLAALLDALDARTLVTGLPCYLDRGGVPSRLVAQFVNNNAALTYLPLLAFAPPPTINGMAYAIASSHLSAIGGFAPLWHRLADDLALARRVLESGGTIVQTPYPQFIATTVLDLRHYRALMHRWFLFAMLLLREQPPAWTLAITLLHGLPPLLLWATLVSVSMRAIQQRDGWMTAVAVALVLIGIRALTLIVVQRSITGRSRHAPLLSIVSELLQPLHLFHAMLTRRIVWRTRTYLVRANDDFRPV
jgi:ceramide glucosyltransferase